MNRIDRISAILIQLQSRKIVKAQDIAERFAISLRTVHRDIRALEEAGIPIIRETGIGYSLIKEAAAFITAEKLVSGLTDAVNGTNYSSALYKIKAVMRNAEKDYIENIDERIHVIKVNRPLPLQSGPSAAIILDAIAGKKLIGYSRTSILWAEC